MKTFPALFLAIGVLVFENAEAQRLGRIHDSAFNSVLDGGQEVSADGPLPRYLIEKGGEESRRFLVVSDKQSASSIERSRRERPTSFFFTTTRESSLPPIQIR